MNKLESKIIRDGSRLLSALDSIESEDRDLCSPPKETDTTEEVDIMKYANDYEIGY